MHPTSALFILLFFFSSSAFCQTYEFRPTVPKPVLDTFFGVEIIDNYRFLEDLKNPQVAEWVKEQNSACRKYLNKMKGHGLAFSTISDYGDTDFNLPRRAGKYYFKWMYLNTHEAAGLFYQDRIKDEPQLLVDPGAFAGKDKISLGNAEISKDSRHVAYSFHRNGSDWMEIKVTDMRGANLSDHLTKIKFSDICWQGKGFYYSKYAVKDSVSNLTNEEIYYHKLGEKQEQDKLFFRRDRKPHVELDIDVTSDERFVIVREKDEQAGTLNFFIRDAHDAEPVIKPLIRKSKYDIGILDSHEGYLYAVTATDTTEHLLVRIDPAQPLNWGRVLPRVEGGLLLDVRLFDQVIATVYQVDSLQKIVFFDYEGNIKHVLGIPPVCAVGGLSGNKTDENMVYYYRSHLIPPIVSEINLKTFKEELLQKTAITFSIKDYVMRDTVYPGKDGIPIPITILHRKNTKLDGTNPALLEAYGGFGVISSPHFEPGLVYFLDKGGVYAHAKIRGGGERGPNWHKMGRGLRKPTSFDDFIAAAEFLIKQKYTAPEHLAITGGSNGGLVVAAAMIRRPDLFRAAIPVVGVFDMIRFERFTIGNFHTDEYGSYKTQPGLSLLKSYSPLHNIKPGVNYPATLLITGGNDDRVPPFHSYKFAAALQNNPGQTNPVLLSVDPKAGHHLGSSWRDRINYQRDLYTFVLHHTKP
jgi:prolyl oligopeptidase